MKKLYVFYDAQCRFCLRCRRWLGVEPAFLPLEFIPHQSPELVARFEGIQEHIATGELVVLGDDGAVYRGPGAFIMCLYALKRYREWALRLSAPALLPFASRFCDLISSQRGNISRVLASLEKDGVETCLQERAEAGCEQAGTCHVRD